MGHLDSWTFIATLFAGMLSAIFLGWLSAILSDVRYAGGEEGGGYVVGIEGDEHRHAAADAPAYQPVVLAEELQEVAIGHISRKTRGHISYEREEERENHSGDKARCGGYGHCRAVAAAQGGVLAPHGLDGVHPVEQAVHEAGGGA